MKPTTIGITIGTTIKNDDDRDNDRDNDGIDDGIDDDRDDDRKGDGDMEGGLGHEKLRVYQRGLDHAAWMHTVLAGIDQSAVVLYHWARAAESIRENIAEGNGRFSEADQTRFLDIAHTCAMRVAACLDVLVVRRQVQSQQIAESKQLLARVVPLVLGLRGYHDDSEPKA